jgi:hypothetical protein
MAFGFPAYHTEQYTLPDSQFDPHELVVEALLDLGWSITEESERVIRASTRVNLWSWGERVTITFRARGRVTVTSECALVTQCLDWGKNRSNVNAFLKRLKKLERSTDPDLR